MQNLQKANMIAAHPAVQGVEARSQGRSGEAPPTGDEGSQTCMVAKSRRCQGEGVQHLQRSVEHKSATQNAPSDGLGLEARGTESGRQATTEPKGKATSRREMGKGKESKKPNAKESLIPLTQQRWGGDDPLATEIHTGEPRPPVTQQQGTTIGSEVRPWTDLRTPCPMETAPLSPLDAPWLQQRAASFLAGVVEGKAKQQVGGRQPPQCFS